MSDHDAIQKMIRLLDRTPHDVYCSDVKERRRLHLQGCARCAWDKLKGQLRSTGFFQRLEPEYAWKIVKEIRGRGVNAAYQRDLNKRLQ